MSYFLTSADLKAGNKCLLNGKLVTPIDISGTQVKLAEDGQWHRHESLLPLTQYQIREELIATMVSLVEGKKISTMKAKGRGVEFVLDDNTRVSLDIAPEENLKLHVIDADGKRIL
jgi:hypothetical protein